MNGLTRFGSAVLFATLGICSSANAVTTEIADFLIQDVCVDSQDKPIAGDPYSCATHRNLRLGEKISYIHTDRGAEVSPGVFQHFQSVFSFPVQSPNTADTNYRVVVAKEFGGEDTYTAFLDKDYCTNSNCAQVWRDGYDVAEMNGTYVAFTGTSDPGRNNQTFWRQGCTAGSKAPSGNEDAWILFPTNLTRGVQGNITHYLTITTNDTCPSSGYTAATAAWDYLSQPLTYTSGKVMDTITSHHFAGSTSTSATSFEKFYFTKIYGFTRWEAWQRSDQCGSGGCTVKVVGCNGDTSVIINGATFYRVDCRDSTDSAVLDYPFEATLFTASPQLSKTQNLIQYATFANQNMGSGVWGRMSPQTTTNWAYYTNQHTPLTANAPNNLSKNVSLAFACVSYCYGNSVYQDVSVSALQNTGTRTIRFGAALKANQAASLTMVAHLFNPSGALLTSKTQTVSVNASFNSFESSFSWDFTGSPLSKIRLEFYPVTGDLVYLLDEAFVVPQ